MKLAVRYFGQNIYRKHLISQCLQNYQFYFGKIILIYSHNFRKLQIIRTEKLTSELELVTSVISSFHWDHIKVITYDVTRA